MTQVTNGELKIETIYNPDTYDVHIYMFGISTILVQLGLKTKRSLNQDPRYKHDFQYAQYPNSLFIIELKDQRREHHFWTTIDPLCLRGVSRL